MSRRIHCTLALTADGWRRDVLLELDAKGMILSLETGAPGPGDQVADGVVLPGMPNLHSHGFQRVVAGLGGLKQGDDSFWTWREAMYRIAGRITPEQFEACMAGLYLDMLRGGYTSCAEFHYLHHDSAGTPYADPAELAARAVRAAADTGLGLTLLPVLYCRAGLGRTGVEPGQRRFHHTPDSFATLLDRCRELSAASGNCRTGVAPHSLRAVSPDELDALLAMTEPGEPVHMHVAEQPAEVEACRKHLGATPVAWLLDHAPVDRRWCLVHATHLQDAELVRAAATGAVAGLCPTTEADLGDGVFRATDWRDADGAWGIGSDSNLRLDAAEELRALEFSQRLRDGARNLLGDAQRSTGRALWEDAASGGARALAQPVGRIGTGHRADLVCLNSAHPLLSELQGDSLLDAYIFAGDRDMIDSVWVGGVRQLRRGRHPRGRDIEAAFTHAMRALRA